MITALQVLFIGLKLLGVINWSWFWVLSPTIGATALFFVFVLIALVAEFGRHGGR